MKERLDARCADLWSGLVVGVLVFVLVLALGGCAAGAPANQQAIIDFLSQGLEITCKGRGSTTISVAGYSGNVQSDCSAEGFSYTIKRTPLTP